ncbi:nitroreductase family deazaflavin-dependent oxidoreductase [Nocardia bhagyanarayanae]|uniref:Deazaflavin-dependent oxidoreductase (Nitroreductase family) n=1 Tax=Nocardia bhagyanarayanae TaxID=1215925 RepID=A0A543FEB3_9NOCA|nr:nitroreductase family deazaflavin-dependent oxidoreductase [Nocardia bhagyanarayanae]TQM32094.1 deazaflavin-dependent oxidoreductase (nitroreductase family) [Nocardia bhagyanarayanae]
MAAKYQAGPVRKVLNRAVMALAARGAGPDGMYILETIGRRSGLARRNPVRIIEFDGQRWLVSPYGEVGWVHNVRARDVVLLRRGHDEQRVWAEAVHGDRAGQVLHQYVKRAPVTIPYFDASPRSAPAVFAAEAHKHPVFLLHGWSETP